jgi:hypothetical protein
LTRRRPRGGSAAARATVARDLPRAYQRSSAPGAEMRVTSAGRAAALRIDATAARSRSMGSCKPNEPISCPPAWRRQLGADQLASIILGLINSRALRRSCRSRGSRRR